MSTMEFIPSLPAKAIRPQWELPEWDSALMAKLLVDPKLFPLSQEEAATLAAWLRQMVNTLEQHGLSTPVLTLGALK